MIKNLYKIHIYIGVFVALHFALFAVTGLILLFKNEIQSSSISTTSSPPLTHLETAQHYEEILSLAKKDFPADRVLAFFPDDDDPLFIHARLGRDGVTELRGSRRLLYDLSSGTSRTEELHRTSGFFEWILTLHRELFMGSNGKLYVGFVGLLYVFLLVSGFIIYGNFMRRRNFGSIRNFGIPKLVDLHKFLGMITFAWSLVVGLTGAFLAFNGILIKLFQLQSLQHLTKKYADFNMSEGSWAPFSQVVHSALQALPNTTISYISFPNTEFGINGHYLFLLNGTEALTERLSTLVVINAFSGQLTEIVNLPLYLKIVLLSEPLHFGDYGGVGLKIIWALFALSSLAVSLLGLSSFVMRRRKNTNKKRVATSRSNNQPLYLLEKTYLAPVSLALLSLIGLVIPLVTSGFYVFFALSALSLPLAIAALRWRIDV